MMLRDEPFKFRKIKLVRGDTNQGIENPAVVRASTYQLNAK
ncbi:hypothetical protein ACFOG5_04840 [Pedobacter fastidiosus]